MSFSIKESITFISSPLAFLSDFPLDNTVLFVDENVHRLYAEELGSFHVVVIPSGEIQKRFEYVEFLLTKLLDFGLDRNGTVIGIGGGVVSDLTGFVGSIYLRGISFGFLPSTLLSVCDAAIGGKNGINFNSVKNIVGTFNQPSFIAIYPEFLRSLSEREYSSGMAEVIKHALINGGHLYDLIKDCRKDILDREVVVLRQLCELAAKVKVRIVEQDVRESGIRKKLNLGHTIGHAIESTSDYSHGECVAIGMVLATKISDRKKLSENGLVNEVSSLCNAYNLPVSAHLDSELLMDKILKDKKRRNQQIDFILPIGVGNVVVMPLEITELKDHLTALSNE